MESCSLSLLKYIFFAFNLIFAITGIIIIAVGAFVINEVSDYKGILDSGILGPAIVFIIVGIVIFVIAFLGCCGAITESYKMLIAFGVCLLIVFIVELSVGIAAAVARNDIADLMTKGLKSSMKDYNNPKSTESKDVWDQIQKRLQCCGIKSSTDWNENEITPPDSCRKTETENYDEGCYDKLKMEVERYAQVIMGIGIGIAFVEILGIIIAFLLAHAIRKGESTK